MKKYQINSGTEVIHPLSSNILKEEFSDELNLISENVSISAVQIIEKINEKLKKNKLNAFKEHLKKMYYGDNETEDYINFYEQYYLNKNYEDTINDKKYEIFEHLKYNSFINPETESIRGVYIPIYDVISRIASFKKENTLKGKLNNAKKGQELIKLGYETISDKKLTSWVYEISDEELLKEYNSGDLAPILRKKFINEIIELKDFFLETYNQNGYKHLEVHEGLSLEEYLSGKFEEGSFLSDEAMSHHYQEEDFLNVKKGKS